MTSDSELRHGEPQPARNDRRGFDKYRWPAGTHWPRGLELTIYDDGRVKVGGWYTSAVVLDVSSFGAGSTNPSGHVVARFQPVSVSLHAESGHITPGRRASLVDAVLDLPEVRESARLKAVFRRGDSESLQRLRQRCDDVSARPAGWSAILEASLPPGGPGSTAQEPAGEAPSQGRSLP